MVSWIEACHNIQYRAYTAYYGMYTASADTDFTHINLKISSTNPEEMGTSWCNLDLQRRDPLDLNASTDFNLHYQFVNGLPPTLSPLNDGYLLELPSNFIFYALHLRFVFPEDIC